jgi:hypothetical protein
MYSSAISLSGVVVVVVVDGVDLNRVLRGNSFSAFQKTWCSDETEECVTVVIVLNQTAIDQKGITMSP